MNPTIKERWIAALQSGEYKQDPEGGALCKVNVDGEVVGYCCLGVLMDMAVQDGIISPPKPHPDILNVKAMQWPTWSASEDEDDEGATEDGVLTREVMEWAGIGEDNPMLLTEHWGMISASVLNDGDASMNIPRHSFSEIAQFIRNTPANAL